MLLLLIYDNIEGLWHWYIFCIALYVDLMWI